MTEEEFSKAESEEKEAEAILAQKRSPDNLFGLNMLASLNTGLYSVGSMPGGGMFLLKGSLESEPYRTFEFSLHHFDPTIETTYIGSWEWVDSQNNEIELKGVWQVPNQVKGIFKLRGSVSI